MAKFEPRIERRLAEFDARHRELLELFPDTNNVDAGELCRQRLGELGARTLDDLHAIAVSDAVNRAAVACFLLGNFGDRRSSGPHLVRVFAATRHEGVRVEAAKALGCLGGRGIARRLRTFLGAPDASVRQFAAYAIGTCRDASVTPELLEVLETDEDPDVREHAAEALGYLHGDGAPSEVVAALVRALDDEPVVRWSAIFALGCGGDATAVQALRRIMETDKTTVAGERLSDKAAWAVEGIEARDGDANHRGQS